MKFPYFKHRDRLKRTKIFKGTLIHFEVPSTFCQDPQLLEISRQKCSCVLKVRSVKKKKEQY